VTPRCPRCGGVVADAGRGIAPLSGLAVEAGYRICACSLADLRTRLDQAERERDEARANFLACAEAIGVVYEADYHATMPGPVEAVVEHIREAVRAERERDEARASAIRVGEECDAAQALARRAEAERDEARAALASEPARIAAAEMARDVAWVIAIDSQCGGADVDDGIACATAEALGVTERVALRLLDGSPTTDEHIAAAIRAARGENR